jgi:hypothetical protein
MEPGVSCVDVLGVFGVTPGLIGLLLAGCAATTPPSGPGWHEGGTEARTDYQIEGEVRDAATLAIVRDAVVEVTTDVPEYGRLLRVDEGGRFSVVLSARLSTYRPLGAIERIGGFDVTLERTIRRISVRARAGPRCSPIRSLELGRIPFPSLRLLLLVDASCESADARKGE